MKKIILGFAAILIGITNIAFAVPPVFDTFKKQLVTDPSGENSTVYNPNTFRVSANSSFRENVFNLFSPTNNGSVLWSFVRIVMIGILVLFFAWAGIDFLLNPNDE
jgi:hypothetical protein